MKQSSVSVSKFYFIFFIPSASPPLQLVQRIQKLLQLLFSLQVNHCSTVLRSCREATLKISPKTRVNCRIQDLRLRETVSGILKEAFYLLSYVIESLFLLI